MYDEVRVEFPLPQGYEHLQDETFQTKDLGCFMDEFVISTDGRLGRRVYEYEEIPLEEQVSRKIGNMDFGPITRRHTGKYHDEFVAVLDGDDLKYGYHGDIRFYTSKGNPKTPEYKWYEFVARFTNGKLEWIKSQDEFNGDVNT